MGGSGKQKATALVTSSAATGAATSRSKVAAAMSCAYFRRASRREPRSDAKKPERKGRVPEVLERLYERAG